MKVCQRLQMSGSLGIAICLFALVINSYILLTIQRSLNFDHLRGLLHENMNKFVLTVKTEMTQLDSRLAMRELKGNQDEDIISPIKMQEVETAVAMDLDDNKDFMPFILQRNITPSFTLGSGHPEKVSLVIGVPSVKRVGVSYLHSTVESLLRKIYPSDEKTTSIVVFLAEQDKDFIKEEAGRLYENFTREFESGLIQVIGPPDDFYPNFDNVEQTLGDPANRVKWRSKEVVDAALLMFLCRHKAEYYVMVEDDIIAAKGYSTAIQHFTETHTMRYLFLSVANLNSIGKIFKTADIPKWASYFLTFYYDKPIDWLMKDYVKLISCSDNTNEEECETNMKKALPTLSYSVFQHIGKKSSLPGKLQPITDSTFNEDATPKIKHQNKPATIEVSKFFPNELKLKDVESWYFDNGGMNKHIVVPRLTAGDAITFTFNGQRGINRILVKTGRISKGPMKRLCESCMSINILSTTVHRRKRNPKDSNFEPCAYADRSGTIECYPPVLISSFQLIAQRSVMTEVWFDLIYVEV